MTEYQKIENELLSLGWEKEQRSGDHIRFTKEGTDQFITVSMSISDKGRALKNTYADIRKAEPRFSLGRQRHMLPADDEEDAAEDAAGTQPLPEGLAAWLAPGKRVRWTAPEGRDWTKLDDPGSLTGQQYTVAGYKPTDSGTMVLIRGGDAEEPFPVKPDELDMWNAQPCSACGKRFPKNLLTTDAAGKYLCPDCAIALVSQAEEKDRLQIHAPKKKSDPVSELLENDPALSEISRCMKELEDIEKATEGNVAEIAAKKSELIALMKEQYLSLPSRTKKLMRKRFPEITGQFEEPEERKPAASLYEAWKECLTTLYEFHYSMLPGSARKQQRKYKAALFASTYTVTRLSGGGKGGSANLITVQTKHWDTVLTLWRGSQSVIRQLRPHLPDAPTFLLAACPPAKFRQYAVDYDSDDRRADLETLKALLPEQEHRFLGRVTRNLPLAPSQDIVKPLKEALEAVGCDFTKDTGYNVYYDVPDPDNADGYETAPSVIRADVIIGSPEAGTFEKACEAIRGADTGPDPVIVTVKDIIGDRDETIDKTEGKLHTETEGEPGGRRILLHLERDAEGTTWIEHDNDTMEVIEALSDALLTGKFTSLLAKAYKRTVIYGHSVTIPGLLPGEDKHKNEKENDNDMNEQNDILELTNPGSEFTSLRDITTRTLLKELILRGVEFNGLTVTVKKTIDPNSI